MSDATQAEVNFHSPSLADLVPPLGLFGAGTIEFGAEGVTLRGKRASKLGTFFFAGLGVLLFFPAGIAAVIALGMEPSAAPAIMIPLVSVGGGLGVLTARKLTPPKTMIIVVPWSNVQALERDGKWITFVSTAAPKGQAWFAAPAGAEATTQLHEQLAAAGKLRVMKAG